MSAERKPGRRLWLALGIGLALSIAAPFALAGGLGRFIGGLWVSVMSAVMALVGSLFGA